MPSQAERLAAALPAECVELILRELARVTHCGKTKIILRHGRDGRITAAKVAGAAPMVRVESGGGAR